ncbi:hypothetical protein, partial [Staphylococcus pasteuri_A]
MKYQIKRLKLRAGILLLMSTVFTANGYAAAAAAGGKGLDSLCHGEFFNPVSDPNSNNFFPISIFGKAFG